MNDNGNAPPPPPAPRNAPQLLIPPPSPVHLNSHTREQADTFAPAHLIPFDVHIPYLKRRRDDERATRRRGESDAALQRHADIIETSKIFFERHVQGSVL